MPTLWLTGNSDGTLFDKASVELIQLAIQRRIYSSHIRINKTEAGGN
jgi:hypothetical protein